MITTTSATTVAIPKQPLTILTPAPRDGLQLPQETLDLIKKNAQELIEGDKTFSVTFSPMVCPAGKNFLFDLHPYYWKTAESHWERRDGLRNPFCDVPEGKKQCEDFARAISILALATAHTPEISQKAREKADHLLRVFFVDPETRVRPEILYSQCIPGEDPLRGNSLFIISCRFLILISQYLPLLTLNNETETQVKEWVRQHIQWMKHSEQGKECAARDDNKVVWYHAVLASHLALVDPEQSRLIAHTFFEDAFKARPTASDYFDERSDRTRPRHYTLFLLEPTFILASLTSLGSTPVDHVLKYLEMLIRDAEEVEVGELEREVDADERYIAKLGLFEKMLGKWRGHDVDQVRPDGSGWSEGWSEWMKIMWALI